MLEEIIGDRTKKTAMLKAEHADPYPARVKRSFSLHDFLDTFATLQKSPKQICLVGRIKSIRDQGKIIFVHIEDASGKAQVVVRKDAVDSFALFKKTADASDFIEVCGKAYVTQRGEKSLDAKKIRIITKSLRALPTDFYGIADTETRLRKRYLDTATNPDTRALFIQKSIFWKSIRTFLEKEGFLSVETPVLEATPGGAEAEPFITHHHALDEDFYLRISLEIALKKMIVGGFEKVYELGRIFRNEGIDAEHLQDYTQLEFYWAYADYTQLMKLVQQLYRFVIKETFGTLTFKQGQTIIAWGKPWVTLDYVDIFKKKNNIDILSCTISDLTKRAKELAIKIPKGSGRGRLIDLIYKKTVRPTLIQPSFLINPPVDIEPLAKRSDKDPRVVERFQVVAHGTELGKGFSELNDPLDQRARFEEQMRLREKGNTEAQRLDEDFLEALEYGMPPTAGFGFSERLFAVLADKPIRETVFLPPMKRKEKK